MEVRYLPKVVKSKQSPDQYLIQEWSKRYRKPISLNDVREINVNLSSFLDTMARIDTYLNRSICVKTFCLKQNRPIIMQRK